MKAHGVLFKGEMMLRLLDGSKTQTRRFRGLEEVNKEPDAWSITWQGYEAITLKWSVQFARRGANQCLKSPWSPMSEIYAKETWKEGTGDTGDRAIFYRASSPLIDGPWKSPLFMRRADSRYRARITQVRCQRLQDITEWEAIAEGVEPSFEHSETCDNDHCALPGGVDDCNGVVVSARVQYQLLWDSINGPGSWNRNPWVFAYTIERIQ